MKKLLYPTFVLFAFALFFLGTYILIYPVSTPNAPSAIQEIIEVLIPTPSPRITLLSPPPQKILVNDYHIFQTFNNCDPASLSMALSYYGINVSQQELGKLSVPIKFLVGPMMTNQLHFPNSRKNPKSIV